MPAVKRILLVDNHPILREGLAKLIEAQEGFTVCAMAGSATEAMSALDNELPDLALTDLTLSSSRTAWRCPATRCGGTRRERWETEAG